MATAAELIDDRLPLPHGTDVVTRVSRVVEGEEVAPGTVGRVVGTHGDELDLQILGVGVVRYLRGEVAPFRSGQLRYALAREAAWNALRPNVVLEAVVGSQAWGLADVLDAHARRVADDVLAEEAKKRRHLVVALSGAHAYGVPSPDCDLDLKAIHIAPTRSLLGLSEPPAASDRMEVIEGVEIDYTSNELGAALRGLVKGNGNYLERVIGAHLLTVSSLLEELAPLVRAGLSKRYYRHYLGFARQQQQDFEKSSAPTAKKILYVLRTALTGTHLLRAGDLRVDLNDNIEEYGYEDARELIERKRAGERTVLDYATAGHWQQRVQRAFALLDDANAKSRLPEEASNIAELERWLVDVRMRDDAS